MLSYKRAEELSFTPMALWEKYKIYTVQSVVGVNESSLFLSFKKENKSSYNVNKNHIGA